MSQAKAIREVAAAQAALADVLSSSSGMLVAFSGGVDSSLLLAEAHRLLGDAVIALTADSPSMPRSELNAAIDLARSLGIRHIVRSTDEMNREEYRRNDRDRCYWCKHTLFEACESVARDHGISEIAYGYTADDVHEYRPGHRAAAEFRVRAPLFEAGLGKEEIRAISRKIGLPVSEKPAAPCLASRIPYGSGVSLEKLERIEAMEDLLHDLGFPVCRARFDGQEMRIEVPISQLARAAEPEIRHQMMALADALSIPVLTLDMEGFRSGKLNEVGQP